jgi:hypothetical protein
MIQTDLYYLRPVVYKMVTSRRDKLIQLDTWVSALGSTKESAEHTLGNSHLMPVSFVSNDAAVYYDCDKED